MIIEDGKWSAAKERTVRPVAKLIGYIHNYAKWAVIGGGCWGHLISLWIGCPGSLGDLRYTLEVLADLGLHVQVVHAFIGFYACFLVCFFHFCGWILERLLQLLLSSFAASVWLQYSLFFFLPFQPYFSQYSFSFYIGLYVIATFTHLWVLRASPVFGYLIINEKLECGESLGNSLSSSVCKNSQVK